jgi:hypothetical protein
LAFRPGTDRALRFPPEAAFAIDEATLAAPVAYEPQLLSGPLYPPGQVKKQIGKEDEGRPDLCLQNPEGRRREKTFYLSASSSAQIVTAWFARGPRLVLRVTGPSRRFPTNRRSIRYSLFADPV